jgi:hypothetical protein
VSDARLHREIENGTALIGSDVHVWPGPYTPAMRAFLHLARDLQPDLMILNGDVFDGATISRFPSIGHETKPSLVEELEACQAYTEELADAVNCPLYWPLGNHDLRFETKLANDLPEFVGVPGFHLKDHFPRWTPCWSLWLNHATPGHTVVKHRKAGGLHARRNNALNAGVTLVTGHTHRLGATPLDDYRGRRWGIETGTLAVPGGPQFVHYTEDDVCDWQSGFVKLTWRNWELLPPTLIYVDNAAETFTYRDQVTHV